MQSYLVRKSDGEILGTSILSNCVPKGDTKGKIRLSDDSRSMGCVVTGARGCGKSLLLGEIAFKDIMRYTPTLLLDPVGGTIDRVLTKILRLPEREREKIWKRIIYVDPSGESGSVVPHPLYYRLGNECLFDQAQRYLRILKLEDPHLIEAPVTGWNAIYDVGTLMGMSLAACNSQITEAVDFLHNPQKWANLLKSLPTYKYPELTDVIAGVEYFASFKNADIQRKKESLLTKINIFALHPTVRAMFGSNIQGVDWREVVARRQAVLIDLRHIDDGEKKRFLVWWFYDYFVKFVKYRGQGRHTPISFIIDELSTFIGSSSSKGQELFAEEFGTFINVISRSHMIRQTIAFQEIWQMPEKILKALMTMGNWVIGNVSDPESAEIIAKIFGKYDPKWERKRQSVWMSDVLKQAYVVDEATTEYSLDEQWELQKRQFMGQGKFCFTVKLASGEGDMRGQLQKLSISHLDGGYVNDQILRFVRGELSKKSGIPISELNEEVRERRERLAEVSAIPVLHPATVVIDHDNVPTLTITPVPAQHMNPTPKGPQNLAHTKANNKPSHSMQHGNSRNQPHKHKQNGENRKDTLPSGNVRKDVKGEDFLG